LQETVVLANVSPRRSVEGGFFLIEAMVAILIFALGILGLVAMGGTAVASQSDAQYRTEASSLADAIAGEIAINIDRTSEATKFASLAQFSHQPTVTAYCDFSGAVAANAIVKSIVDRAANLTAVPGMPGASPAMQQVVVAPAGTFNRVEITLCWKTATDSAPRKHTLVTYVN
jgi:type IV pilus assembly protein PilV